MMKTTFTYDHYFDYEELMACLEYFQETYPRYFQMQPLVKTKQQRDVVVCTLSNHDEDPSHKPALYIDGNIHAGEVTASMVAMYFMDGILSNLQQEHIQKLLNQYTVYVIPRIAVDGAQMYLKTPHFTRSSDQVIQQEEGYIAGDYNEDGWITMCKVYSPYGRYTMENDRIVARKPWQTSGVFFDLITESEKATLQKRKIGYHGRSRDFNRNFPYGWFSEQRQFGAGNYPLEANETRAIVDFILQHPNICCASIGHTSGGVVLYPPGTYTSQDASAFDMQMYQEIAQSAKQHLGYDAINIFDSFITQPKVADSGALDDYLYEEHGILAYTMEYWDYASRANKPIVWNARTKENLDQQIERFYAYYQWVQKNYPQYVMEPQKIQDESLGEIEIFGFNRKWTIQNPPECELATICQQAFAFHLDYLATLPNIELSIKQIKQLSDTVAQVEVQCCNTGYLSSFISEKAIQLNKTKGISIEIDHPCVDGQPVKMIEDLDGYSKTVTGLLDYGQLSSTYLSQSEATVTFIIKARKEEEIIVTLQHPKCGKKQISFKIA